MLFSIILTCLVVVLAIGLLSEWRKYFSSVGERTLGYRLLWYSSCVIFIFIGLVWVVRSFVIQPYWVPTGSLEPTIIPGDVILVKQYAYGLRSPLTGNMALEFGSVRRGDIALFYKANDPHIYVKRVVGLPGDHIVYNNRHLYINNHKIPDHYIDTEMEVATPHIKAQKVIKMQENLFGKKYFIYLYSHGYSYNLNRKLGKDCYYVLGDNRDNSQDSRDWGCVNRENFIGKVFAVWLSYDIAKKKFRWSRSAQSIL